MKNLRATLPEIDLNSYIEQVFDERFAAKGYDPNKAVSERDWETILHAGRMSPSSVGLEPWQFVRLTDRNLIDALAPHAWGARDKFAGASHCLLLLVRSGADLRTDSAYVQHILRDVKGFDEEAAAARARVIDDFRSRDLGFETEAQLQEWATRQVYIALANMLTAAALLGVDATPIEGFNLPACRQLLSAAGVYDPAHFDLAVMAAFGYANVPGLPKSRQRLEAVYREV